MVSAPSRLRLPDGRTLAYDDVGDPTGVPVVYLHGTPDSRLARHPDDGRAAAARVRLVAVDRPGAGASSPHPSATLASLGHDLAVLLDHLGVDRAGVLAWSSGGLFALAASPVLGERVPAITLVGTVPPVEAYDDPAVVAALSPARQHFVELVAAVPADELATEMAPYLVPDPLDPALALEHVLEGTGPRGRAELDAVPGAAERLAAALVEAVAQGRNGLVHDVALALEPGLPLHAVTAQIRTVHGHDDGISPPAVGEWLAARLPSCTAEAVDGAHHLLFPHWGALLADLAARAAA